jgi:D-hydroxyproline dehydrogenase subunit alpha
MLERYDTDILVIGAGPAGLAAAVCAAESGRRVIVLDDNLGAGGNIWRGETQQPKSPGAALWFARVRQAQLTIHQGTRVFQQPEPQCLLAETAAGVREYRYRKLILATCARERFLPFPGWTLPNVMGAGGLQALVKSGLPIAGKRVVIAGSGPLLLAVAAHLREHGAKLALIAEQADWSKLFSFGAGLWRTPGKIAQAFKMKVQLAGVPQWTSCWPVAANGNGNLQSVTVRHGNQTKEIACDYLACGFHLVPNIELPVMLDCEVTDGYVAVDEWQQSSTPDVYAAGEITSIGGVELSLTEGQIAGYAAAEKLELARQLFAERSHQQRFAEALNRTFALRDELRALPQADTLVCRCEDVSYERLRQQLDWRSAKLHTRCGMGPCQGRICGSAIEFLQGWGMSSVRPPVFPVKLASLMMGCVAEENAKAD